MKPRDLVEFFDAPAAASFTLVPEQALAFFRAKGLATSFSWQDLVADEHATAFTVAKMMDIDLLRDVQESLADALERGVPFREWADGITQVLQGKGWWGRQRVVDPVSGQLIVAELGSPGRLRTIFRTNMQSAYSVGAWQRIQQQAAEAPYLLYDAVDDHRTRPEHAAWDGRVYPVDSPFWRQHYPPNGWNSVVPDQRVSGFAYLGLKAWYAGEVVEVVGKSGGRFTVTAQHPVLTTRGWIDAKALRKGDQLVAYRAEVGRGAVPADQHEHDAPPTIEQVFDALGAGAAAAVPAAALHLNGDAEFFDGEVQIVGADRELVEHVEASGRQLAAEIQLLLAGQARGPGLSLGSDGEGFGVNRAALADAPDEFGAVLRPVLQRNGSVRVRFDPVSAKVLCDGLPALAEAGGQLAERDPGLVELEDFLGHRLAQVGARPAAEFFARKPGGLAAGAYGHTAEAQVFVGGFSVNADAHRDLLNGQAGLVQLDEVADLFVRDYCGHVYDLQTASGTIAAYGGENKPQYVISNCRCGVIQLSDDDLQALGMKVSPPPRITMVETLNPRTGGVLRHPPGVDPSFAYNPGQLRQEQLQRLALEKVQQLDDGMKRAALDGIDATKAVAREVARGVTPTPTDAEDAARAAMRAAERQARGELDAALAKGTPYLARAIRELEATAAGKSMSPVELLAQAKARAAKLKDQALLAQWRTAYLAGREPPPAARAVFDAMPEEARLALREKLDAQRAAAEAAKLRFDPTTPAGQWHAKAWGGAPSWQRPVLVRQQAVELLPREPGRGAYARRGQSIHMADYSPESEYGRSVWRHEFGHIIDQRLGVARKDPWGYRSAADDFTAAMRADAEDLLNDAGKAGKGMKARAAALEAEHAAIRDRMVDMNGSAERQAYLARQASALGFDLEELRAVLRANTQAVLDGIAGDVRMARILRALEVRDVDRLLDELVGRDRALEASRSMTSEQALDYSRMVAGSWKAGVLGCLSDLFGAATNNRLADFARGYNGHSDAYYRGWFGAQQTEAFANLTALAGAPSPLWWRIVERMTPRMARLYREILEDAGR